VPDILSQGGGRESGPWPRRVAAVAVLVLVAVLIVHYLPQSRHQTARPARGAVTVTPPPAVSSAVSGDAGVVEEPDGITGQILSWPGGLRLADAVAPGVPGTLWLTSYPPDAAPRTAAGVARDISIAGRQLGPRFRLPAGYLIEQGTSRGLLLAPVTALAGTIADKLWDPAAPQASRTFDGVIAASATQIAWSPSCVARCHVQVQNLANGRRASVESASAGPPAATAWLLSSASGLRRS
jgi:hypothetical protein